LQKFLISRPQALSEKTAGRKSTFFDSNAQTHPIMGGGRDWQPGRRKKGRLCNKARQEEDVANATFRGLSPMSCIA
jgi:hypothetical protein